MEEGWFIEVDETLKKYRWNGTGFPFWGITLYFRLYRSSVADCLFEAGF